MLTLRQMNGSRLKDTSSHFEICPRLLHGAANPSQEKRSAFECLAFWLRCAMRSCMERKVQQSRICWDIKRPTFSKHHYPSSWSCRMKAGNDNKQRKIVRRVKSLFSLADQLEARLPAEQRRIDALMFSL